MIKIKRVYDDPAPQDGKRVLVDRIWPRGLRKDDVPLAEWLKEVGPSTELRKWYGHDPQRYAEFSRRYKAELKGSPHLAHLRELARHGNLTLLTASREVDISQAAVLRDLLH